jgi:anti-sigma factor RsiW
MTSGSEIELMRLLHGELPAERERELRDRLAREPELAAVFHRLERGWQGLELPPPSAVPPGLTARVMARVRERRGAAPALSWAAAPAWVRAAAAVALVAGLAMGAEIGSRGGLERSRPAYEDGLAGAIGGRSLAESYWGAVDEITSGTAVESGGEAWP